MKTKTKVFLLELPAMLLLIGSFLASVYAKLFTELPVNWGTVVLLFLILGTFFLGRKIEKHEMRHYM